MRYDLVVGAEELVPGRPFTDAAETLRESDVMRSMLARERERAAAWAADGKAGLRVVTELDGDRRHLFVVPDTAALVGSDGLTAVGFFSRAREGVDHSILFELEEGLVQRMHRYASMGLLSYYDADLGGGAYGNLILFSTPDVPEAWHRDELHRRAVELSPLHYHEVRLHKGSISGRLLEGGPLTIERTKYFDFDADPTWHGLRRYALRAT